MNRPILYKKGRYSDGLFIGFDKEYTARGTFLAIGSDYEEFENGPGNYSTAIVETLTGEVIAIPVTNIKFTDVKMAEVFDEDLANHQEDMSKIEDCKQCGEPCSGNFCSNTCHNEFTN